jgi:hypothetical protein
VAPNSVRQSKREIVKKFGMGGKLRDEVFKISPSSLHSKITMEVEDYG